MKAVKLNKGGAKFWYMLVALLLLISYTPAKAQWNWGNDSDDEEEVDSTDNDEDDGWGSGWGDDSDDDNGGGWGGGWGDDDGGSKKDDKGTPPVPLVKYERIDLIPVDTLTKLITYTEIHDVEDVCDYCTSDSLYFRVKKYLLTKYGNGKVLPKKWIIEDTQDQRIIMKVRVPLITHPNEYSNVQEGEYEFKFQLWIRDYAYKYKFIDFVHYEPILRGKPGEFNTVYMEYYLKNKVKVRQTDMLLLAIDRDMKELIDDIVRIMKDPVTVDIDEEDF